MKRLCSIVAAMALLMMAAGAQAAAEVRLAAWKVVAAASLPGGLVREQLEPVDRVLPGDTIEYQATYANGSAAPARNVQVTLPIPQAGLVWQPPAGAPDTAVQASLDGERFEAVPLMRAEVMPDGRRVMRRVPLGEYRFLRWQLGDLPAGATRSVRARMQFAAPAAASAVAPR
ncbi:hypothetical protein V4F39_04520 [Aquincola sp. MAHUQ-54]|uniref:DUF11 domain-containing protein n=1 Tax=Aquincola agrisoli TaxID=3119538 RepID=A0AAW9Q020_9BURK